MGFKKSQTAAPQAKRYSTDTQKPQGGKVAAKATEGPNPDKTAKPLDHMKVQTLMPKDGTYSKADLDKRIAGQAQGFINATSKARTSSLSGNESKSTTASPYPTKNDLGRFGFSGKGGN